MVRDHIAGWSVLLHAGTSNVKKNIPSARSPNLFQGVDSLFRATNAFSKIPVGLYVNRGSEVILGKVESMAKQLF